MPEVETDDVLDVANLEPGRLSRESLVDALDQSIDCVKLIGLDGRILYMNANGLCAMEIDSIERVRGKFWADLWPDETGEKIRASYAEVDAGEAIRFRAFCPTMQGSPRWWDVTLSSVLDEAGSRVGYLSISRDVTEAQRGREALDIAARELHHRLKNTYTMIGSLLAGFARGNPQKEAFAKEMRERLVTLARAQSFFVSGDAPCHLQQLVLALVQPFETPTCSVTIDAAPDVELDRLTADAVALTLGELSVNSSKHGAICHGGTVDVTGSREDGEIVLRWHEVSNRPVQCTRREGGQGLALISRLLVTRSGRIDIDWRANGPSFVVRMGKT